MKTVNVQVTIQMDIKGEDETAEVGIILDAMNKIVGQSELESQPQIFTQDVCGADISDSPSALNEDND